MRMSPRPQLVAALGLLAIFVAACGASPTENPSPSTGAASTPPSPAESVAGFPSVAPFDHGEIPAEIPGRYAFSVEGREWVIDLASDGTYTLIRGPLAFGQGTVEVLGAYGVFGDEMRFGNEVAVSGHACPGDGTYNWSFDGSTLSMTVIEDECPTDIGRIVQWESGWSRTD